MSLSVALLKTRRFSDDRGWFSETYSAPRLAELGIDTPFVQDNQSFSVSEGTVRGIHFQRPPYAQAKLVRCIRGKILDFAIDLRGGSPSFGKYVSAELSAENGDQLFIPVGFGHAFITLEDNCEIAYKISAVYSPECDGGIIWNDEIVAVDWPVPPGGAILSEKDRKLPHLRDFVSPFEYTGQPLKALLES